MRPKTFDQTQALEAAMFQFWESGFEGSSMQNLVDRMGISRQSLYDTYGNKRELFESALARYREEIIEPKLAELTDPELTPTEAIRRYLVKVSEGLMDAPVGCLMVRTATEIPIEDAEIGEILRQCINDVFNGLVTVVKRGQASGEFDSARSARDLAGSVVTSGMGLHVMRRLPGAGQDFKPSVDALLDGIRSTVST